MTTRQTVEPLFEFMFRRTSEGVLLVDAEALLVNLNPAAAAMLQATPSEVIGLTTRVAFSNNPLLVRLMRVGEPSPMTLDIPLPQGRIAQGTAEDLSDGNRVIILNDVTELRNLESRRDELVRTVAHDLRNPLNGMAGYADLILKFGDVNERQERFITRIRQTCSKLIEVSSSLVNLAWFEAGMPMDYLPFDMSSLVRAVLRDKSPLAQSKQQRLIVSMQNAMPAIMGHPKAIQQAIDHLVENAIHYSAPMSNIVIHGWQKENEVLCSVADRGIGIADDELDFIWDRMWRSPRVQDTPGGGLGLTYARMVIERHGGKIWVESEVNKGTIFTFSLPFIELSN